ncbi:MAG: hypothetical protein ACNA78_10390, partial [Balneolaceae bacterium]
MDTTRAYTVRFLETDRPAEITLNGEPIVSNPDGRAPASWEYDADTRTAYLYLNQHDVHQKTDIAVHYDERRIPPF